jgi:hypothetical protein
LIYLRRIVDDTKGVGRGTVAVLLLLYEAPGGWWVLVRGIGGGR